ncbi:NAD-dependent succinate-semialdehyde dehydrogenase [Sphingobacteriales bacterium UPWRP_1]|nr:succinate-semialdehyde dehydrogenase [Sphingobacteriales bacterium TSM_CSS]PSJ73014.1 NAD-dependent succinate-semialdehyde dehydrogenase [Sphingobacteriales bacterium UPWRP_1]
MRFETINPVNNELVKRFPSHTWRQVQAILKKSETGFDINRTSTLAIRSKRMKALADLLENKKLYCAQMITLEMGKPIKEAIAEIEKCVKTCHYFADNAKFFLADEVINTQYSNSTVSYMPLGPILAIMPWNFPFWQVIRFAAPSVMAGNSVLLKPAPNVPQCALLLEELFLQAAFPEGVFQNLFIEHNKVRWVIEDAHIAAVTLTGSDAAGASVAALAGKNIKKTVLELGGSDPFIVLEDANVKEAAHTAVKSRMINGGQSCIAAKRFIVMETVFSDFVREYVDGLLQLKMGDPTDSSVDIGPMARQDLADKLEKQVKDSMRMGAEALIGGGKPHGSAGAYFNPTLLVKVRPGMPVFDQEVFGPVASVITAKTINEAIELANKTKYGLGASIWTVDTEKAQRLARQIQAGSVFINQMVVSDPRLPFGGIKNSGYGRELAACGIREFTNIKTIVVK